MISITILIYSVFVLKVHSQEVSDVGTRFTTETTTSAADFDVVNERNFQNANSQFSRNDQFQPYLPAQYGPVVQPFPDFLYGTRLQFDNRTDTIPRYLPSYEVPLDAYSVNWTDNDNSFIQPPSVMQYPQGNGLFPFSGVPYLPPRLMEDNRYAPIDDSYNPAWQNDGFRSNWTAPPPIIYPENTLRRQNRVNSGTPFVDNLPDPDFIQRRHSDVRNTERSIPFPQYPLPSMYLPPLIIGSNKDKNVNPEQYTLNRPPYFDRESGTEPAESVPIKTVPQTQPSLPLEPISVESPIPEETKPRRVFPRRPFFLPRSINNAPPYAAELFSPRFIPSAPFPINSLPYGMPIPPPELISPFTFPAGLLPPTTPPPTIPNIPIGSNENILPSIPNEPTPVLSQPSIRPDAPLPPPVENIPVADAEAIPSEINGNITPVKAPYEFGYEMNDGKGTDQHRKEFSDGSGTVTGSYGYRDGFGMYRLVNYVADRNGFRAFVKTNEPGVANPGSADVRVEAEVPPPKAIEEGLRSVRLNAIEIPNEPPLPMAGEKK